MKDEKGVKKVDMHQENLFYEPKFFTKEDAEDGHMVYKPITGDQSYWAKREAQDWSE